MSAFRRLFPARVQQAEIMTLRRQFAKMGELATEVINEFDVMTRCDQTPEMESRIAKWCDRALGITRDLP